MSGEKGRDVRDVVEIEWQDLAIDQCWSAREKEELKMILVLPT